VTSSFAPDAASKPWTIPFDPRREEPPINISPLIVMVDFIPS